MDNLQDYLRRNFPFLTATDIETYIVFFGDDLDLFKTTYEKLTLSLPPEEPLDGVMKTFRNTIKLAVNMNLVFLLGLPDILRQNISPEFYGLPEFKRR